MATNAAYRNFLQDQVIGLNAETAREVPAQQVLSDTYFQLLLRINVGHFRRNWITFFVARIIKIQPDTRQINDTKSAVAVALSASDQMSNCSSSKTLIDFDCTFSIFPEERTIAAFKSPKSYTLVL